MKKTNNKIRSWSYSRYAVYKQCPLKAKFKFIDRIPEPTNDAMERGTRIHKLAEDFIKGGVKELPNELSKFKGLFLRLRRKFKKKILQPVIEDSWSFTNTWGLTRYDDWDNCWLRVKVDAGEFTTPRTLTIYDWKTGKYRPEEAASYLEQLDLYGLSALLTLPNIDVVNPKLVYVDYGDIYPLCDRDVFIRRENLEEYKHTWMYRTKMMMSDTVFQAKPNNKCRWCHYRKENVANGGGQCQY